MSHLQFRWKVDPQLKAIQMTAAQLRHFFVHDSATGRHPLNVTGADAAGVAE